MRLAQSQDLDGILGLLRAHVGDCLYMYIDIAKYGLDHPAMKVWLAENADGITTVVMKYHTGISFFADCEDWDKEGVIRLLQEEKPNSVTARKDLVESVLPEFADAYETEYGYVFLFTKFQPMEIDVPIERATEADLMEIAELVTSDHEVGSYFEVRDLAEQYKERMETSMGRNFFIREDGKIVAHIASYAEFDGLATTSRLIVDPNCRNSIYGAYLEKYLLDDLIADGFTVYTFITNRLRYRLLKAMGNECVGEYGKMMIRES